MKLSERKQKLVKELASLYKQLDVVRLYGFPNQKDTQQWVAGVASILKSLDEIDYQEFVRLSKTVGLSNLREERKKAAYEINQFLGRKVAEWERYDFRSLDEDVSINRQVPTGILNRGKGAILASNKFTGLGIGILDEGQKTKILGNDFQGKQEGNPKSNFGNITISGGTVIFGDGNKITQVSVKELVNALSEEIEDKVPQGKEKQSILQSLKEITTNETFASVAGTVIGEILRRVTRP
jgi:hypothetical protein